MGSCDAIREFVDQVIAENLELLGPAHIAWSDPGMDHT